MALLLKRNLGTVPPTGPITIDWGHPLAAALVFYAHFNAGRTGAADLVTGVRFTPGATPFASKPGPNGAVGISGVATFNGGSWSSPYAALWPQASGEPHTFVWEGWLTANGSSGGTLFGTFAGNNAFASIQRKAASNDELSVRAAYNGGILAIDSSGLSLSTNYGMPFQAAITRTPGVVTTGYYNAVPFGTNTTNTSAGVGPVGGIYIGRSPNGDACGGYSTRGLAWRRALAPSDLEWLRAEPFAFLTQGSAARSFFFLQGQTVITGTIAVTEHADTSAATGAEVIVGSIALTETADDPAATGTEVMTGTIAVTEQPDSSVASGTVTNPANLTPIEELHPQKMPRPTGSIRELVRIGDEALVQVRITSEASIRRRNGDDDAILML